MLEAAVRVEHGVMQSAPPSRRHRLFAYSTNISLAMITIQRPNPRAM